MCLDIIMYTHRSDCLPMQLYLDVYLKLACDSQVCMCISGGTPSVDLSKGLAIGESSKLRVDQLYMCLYS